MNSVAVFRLSQLSIGVSRTSIRHGSTLPRRRVPQPELTKFEPGHGEQIWVYSHLTSNQIIYSHSKQLDSNRAHKQLPFNGKKTKPAKLRRDYWEPMALIQLPPGAGAAGQAVFQKLREFRRLHELCWDDSLLYETRTNPAGEARKRYRNRQQRGFALNDQRANSIADMAAVLSGAGRGNRLFVSAREKTELLEQGKPLVGVKWAKLKEASEARFAAKSAGATAAAAAKGGADENVRDELLPATIFWVNETDRNFAEKWSDNVTHDLFEHVKEQLAKREFAEVVEESVLAAEEPRNVTVPDDTRYIIKEATEKADEKVKA
ncbi:hypothetical protein CCHL11_00530 [Colletotrichum chlorophyti]|uniref:Large ribosomal subunit protein mL67 n=1 Tax=Colletotrichum chlorophyti TaxID=708187 RepID=A0A1Q8RTV6_9PEZI|nr:hypothetical protein CCHL11_00530 [Colletotrichum chlorophyti]